MVSNLEELEAYLDKQLIKEKNVRFSNITGSRSSDAELLTSKERDGFKKLMSLVFDRLVNQELFQHLKPDCERLMSAKILWPALHPTGRD